MTNQKIDHLKRLQDLMEKKKKAPQQQMPSRPNSVVKPQIRIAPIVKKDVAPKVVKTTLVKKTPTILKLKVSPFVAKWRGKMSVNHQ